MSIVDGNNFYSDDASHLAQVIDQLTRESGSTTLTLNKLNGLPDFMPYLVINPAK
jgi:hypothetical protein